MARAPQEPCVELPGDPLNGPAGVAVSPDGKSVYTLSEPGAVSVAIQRSRGRRWVRAATLQRVGQLGANQHRFSGRIRRRKLTPGRYRAVFTAADAGGNRSSGARIGFRVQAR